MKKIIIILILAVSPLIALSQEVVEKGDENKFALIETHDTLANTQSKSNIDKWGKGRRWALGVQLGTDIGGAIPVPFKYIPSTFNPYPKLNISLGVRGSWSYNARWSVHAELTYKQVTMEADARVENQRADLEGTIQYYSGTAFMVMDFTMIEIPVYAKMALSKKYNDFLILGGYYAYNINPKFVTIATNGYVGGLPDEVDGVITPDAPMEMSFTESLTKHDAGIIVGYERRIWDRANIGFRLMVGFKDIFQSDKKALEYQMWHMRGSLNIEYDLFLIK